MDRYSYYDAEMKPCEGGTDAHIFTADHLQNLTFAVDFLGGKEVPDKKADKLIAECRLAGLEGWRKPTVEEEFLACDRTRYAPAKDPVAFPRQPAYGWVWTSTPWAPDASSGAWIVLLGDGYASTINRYYPAFVRAVRSGVPSSQ